MCWDDLLHKYFIWKCCFLLKKNKAYPKIKKEVCCSHLRNTSLFVLFCIIALQSCYQSHQTQTTPTHLHNVNLKALSWKYHCWEPKFWIPLCKGTNILYYCSYLCDFIGADDFVSLLFYCIFSSSHSSKIPASHSERYQSFSTMFSGWRNEIWLSC